MYRIHLVLAAFVLLLTALWLAADTLLPTPLTYFSFRTVFVQLSGVLAMGLMSLAMLLALRPQWLEPRLQGLDKMYRLHKWLGIGALVASVLHWWWAQGTKWMVGWGWLEKPVRKAVAAPTPWAHWRPGCAASAAWRRTWANGRFTLPPCSSCWPWSSAFPTTGLCKRTA